MFALPELDSCCCCFSLRTGTKVFGFYSLCRSIFVIIVLTLQMTVIAGQHPEMYAEVSYLTSLEILLRVVQGAASLLMLLAAYQESRKFLFPCIWTTVVMIVINVILPSLLRRTMIILRHEQFWALLTVTSLVTDLYGLLVVYSYYRSLMSLGCRDT